MNQQLPYQYTSNYQQPYYQPPHNTKKEIPWWSWVLIGLGIFVFFGVVVLTTEDKDIKTVSDKKEKITSNKKEKTTNSAHKHQKSKPVLTRNQKTAVLKALRRKGMGTPTELYVSSSYLVAKYQFKRHLPSRRIAELFARKAILIIRNAMYPFHNKKIDAYRVTMLGPSPGPGLILVYGAVRFIEGSSIGIVWQRY